MFIQLHSADKTGNNSKKGNHLICISSSPTDPSAHPSQLYLLIISSLYLLHRILSMSNYFPLVCSLHMFPPQPALTPEFKSSAVKLTLSPIFPSQLHATSTSAWERIKTTDECLHMERGRKLYSYYNKQLSILTQIRSFRSEHLQFTESEQTLKQRHYQRWLSSVRRILFQSWSLQNIAILIVMYST